MTAEPRLRLVGMDTPERNERCAEEHTAAEVAHEALIRLVAAGVVLGGNLELDRHGRFPGRRRTHDGRDVAEAVIAAGHARPCGETGPRPSRCF